MVLAVAFVRCLCKLISVAFRVWLFALDVLGRSEARERHRRRTPRSPANGTESKSNTGSPDTEIIATTSGGSNVVHRKNSRDSAPNHTESHPSHHHRAAAPYGRELTLLVLLGHHVPQSIRRWTRQSIRAGPLARSTVATQRSQDPKSPCELASVSPSLASCILSRYNSRDSNVGVSPMDKAVIAIVGIRTTFERREDVTEAMERLMLRGTPAAVVGVVDVDEALMATTLQSHDGVPQHLQLRVESAAGPITGDATIVIILVTASSIAATFALRLAHSTWLGSDGVAREVGAFMMVEPFVGFPIAATSDCSATSEEEHAIAPVTAAASAIVHRQDWIGSLKWMMKDAMGNNAICDTARFQCALPRPPAAGGVRCTQMPSRFFVAFDADGVWVEELQWYFEMAGREGNLETFPFVDRHETSSADDGVEVDPEVPSSVREPFERARKRMELRVATYCMCRVTGEPFHSATPAATHVNSSTLVPSSADMSALSFVSSPPPCRVFCRRTPPPSDESTTTAAGGHEEHEGRPVRSLFLGHSASTEELGAVLQQHRDLAPSAESHLSAASEVPFWSPIPVPQEGDAPSVCSSARATPCNHSTLVAHASSGAQVLRTLHPVASRSIISQ